MEEIMKVNVKAFALALALLWGFGLMFIAWWIILFDGPTGEPTLIGKVYRGFNISMTGGLIGFVWGFFDGLIGGAILASLYNYFVSKLEKEPAR